MPSSPPGPSSPVNQSEPPTQNGAQQRDRDVDGTEVQQTMTANAADEPSAPVSDTAARLEAMQQERDSLHAEVTKLRQSIESLQAKHEEDLAIVKDDLEQSQQSKEHAEAQYRSLLGKVNTIRSQLGERLKQDAEELEQARGKIEELESSSDAVKEDNERLQGEVSTLNSKLEEQTSEIESLRSRTTLSTSNWAKERDDLIQREAYIREEYEVARQAMQDWEILATEERSRREALEERMTDLEDQLGGSREAYERVRSEAETQNSTVDGLQRALRDLQEERKKELREMVKQSQAQLDELKKQAKLAEDGAAELKQQLEVMKKELDRALPFEKEVKEKNLLIGKLRHEAVILNDHLTKALRFLKRGKPEDNVDRQLVTNHFLHFLALDRSDPKKFQVLQLIAALLGWDEQQKEQAGLLRTGSSGTGSLKLPMSPYRRTPSTPALTGDFVPESPGGPQSKESLAELWSDFLERESEAGGGGSRRGSTTKSVRSASLVGQTGGLGIVSPTSELPGRVSPEIRRTDSGGGK
ncbi:hypothetical protein BAUCODRAFT_33207 [Baudoinia panamericana UAMH 10762]|uniref:GRIP domain-containing protein n=1 Tax=Baudoinia panamericana (strain UAMH 10762) TaxID=717646 RepID=M2N0Q5_BAUPA|nr:uncharacterized protein BAUCODRAFT_33207 [Baudoinia panamericana UAMH 10762]EMC97493.1 hypothetical protein BAUCODRAFT_33207 [Baudoinia panamericana UAMH 10762]